MSEFIEDGSTKPSDKILTVPNAITVLGAGLVAEGLYGKSAGIDTVKGAGIVAAGMVLDAVDGAVARHLPDVVKGIKPDADTERLGPSKFGNRLDHVLDKAKSATLIVELARKDIVPEWMAITFATLEATKAVATVALYADHLGDEDEFDAKPTDSGRYGNALMLAGIGIESVTHFMEKGKINNRLTKGFKLLGRIAFGAGTALTVKATKTYIDWLNASDDQSR